MSDTQTPPPPGTQGATPPEINWDQKVPVKVNGIEQMLSLNDLRNGYATQASMHEARTRANQLEKDLARYKATFDELDSDPAQFIEKVKQHFNLAPESGGSSSGEEINHNSAELARLRAEVERLAGSAVAQEQQTAQERQLMALQAQHGESFKRDELMAYATSKGVDNLEHAWLMMQGERGPQTVEVQAHTPHQDALESILSQKARALGAVSPGAGPAAGAQKEGPLPPPSSPAEALHRALSEHGTDMDGLMRTVMPT